MHNKFVILYLKKEFTDNKLNDLTFFFKGLLDVNTKIEHINDFIILRFNNNEEIDFKEISNIIVNELYYEVVLFEGKDNFINESYISEVCECLLQVDVFYPYLNEKSLFNIINKVDKEEITKSILGKYYDDLEMLNIIKVFLQCNMNTSKAASILYLHRNTLINKVDKFINVTGYNIKDFKDAYIIYTILK